MTQAASSQTPSQLVSRMKIAALVVGIAAGIACAIAAAMPASRSAFFSAYLYAYLFWLGVSLGSLCIIMLHNLTGGEWGMVVRRIADPATRLVPLMLLLFIPILLGMHDLFPWARPEELAKQELLRHRAPYLNVTFFAIRAGIYFIVWIVLAAIVRSLGQKLLRSPSDAIRSRLRGWSAAGLIIYLMTMTHASYDWTMSRDTDFYSTTFGFIITVGQTLSGLAFIILILAILNRSFSPPLMTLLNRRPEQNPPEAGAPNILNDVGNILLTLIILWAYVSFMQLLVIWMGNTSEDNGYYLKRGLGQPSFWRWIGLTLVVAHFFLPFFLLLFRSTKKYLKTLTIIAAILFAAHLLEQYWLTAPSPDLQGPHFHVTWLDLITPLAIGGIWFAGFLMMLPSSLATLQMDPWLLAEAQLIPRMKEGPHHA